MLVPRQARDSRRDENSKQQGGVSFRFVSFRFVSFRFPFRFVSQRLGMIVTDGLSGEYCWAISLVRRNKCVFFAPFLYVDDHFAKTGSGRTQGKLSKVRAFLTHCSATGPRLWSATALSWVVSSPALSRRRRRTGDDISSMRLSINRSK